MFSHTKLLYLKNSFKKLFRHVMWPDYCKRAHKYSHIIEVKVSAVSLSLHIMQNLFATNIYEAS